MTWREMMLAGFAGKTAADLLFVPDLTLWHRWHSVRGTLPPSCAGASLPELCQKLGLPAWIVRAPWRLEWQGMQVTVDERTGAGAGPSAGPGMREIRYEAQNGLLTARWALGRDGDWWQTDYPIRGAADLPAAAEIVAARTYLLDTAGLPELAAEVGDGGVMALELPMRPYADILHTLLGWQEGLLLWADEGKALLSEMLIQLEEKMARLEEQVAALPGELVLAPDNLDGQFISPRAFRQYLLPSYQRAAATLHAAGKRLIVHAGGPVRRLLPLLAEAGVDAIAGVAGPPQGDSSLPEARTAAGPAPVLWGGLPQDFLLSDIYDDSAFAEAVQAIAQEARSAERTVVGIADHVPPEADIHRLRQISSLLLRPE